MTAKSLLLGIACGTALAATPVAAQQGSPNTTPTTVSRVTLIRIKPARTEQFWTDMRQHIKPLYEEYKKAGLITDYAVSSKVSTESENDWNVRLVLTYRNYGALDDLAAKTAPISDAHYKSAAARTSVLLARTENATTVASYLERGQIINDWK